MDRSKGAVAGLPDDPLVEILSRIPTKSVCRFRCVCKAWRGLIDDPLNRRKLPQTLEGFFVLGEPMRSAAGHAGHLDFIRFLARSVPLDIDPFSFLTKLPENESLYYQDFCNGLLLLEHYQKRFEILCSYIVCNPATKHWGTVPLCGCYPPSVTKTFLAFDPAVSPHFHLIQFWKPPYVNHFIAVHAYPSETGLWSHSDEHGQLEGWRHQGVGLLYAHLQRAFVNGILHLIVAYLNQAHMVAVDVQGKTKRMISLPAAAEGRCWSPIPYIGQSQGRLHYINHDFDAQGSGYELSVWVLQDYDTQEWVLKDTMTFLKLFGIMTADMRQDFDCVAIHPDCNMVFFCQPFNRLIANDMDRKEVSVVASVGSESRFNVHIVPYIPYFSESPMLTNKD